MANPDIQQTYKLVRRVRQDPHISQQGDELAAVPDDASDAEQDAAAAREQNGGLLGRFLALLATQKSEDSRGDFPGAAQTPDFRQLRRIPITGLPQETIAPLNQPGGSWSPSFPSSRSGGSIDDPDVARGGLLGELATVPVQQGPYRWMIGKNGQLSTTAQAIKPGQVSLTQHSAVLATANPPILTTRSLPVNMRPAQQYETNQAEQAREAAAKRLARGVRSLPRAQAPAPDFVDIGKSTGIGLANGVIGMVGLPADISTAASQLVDALAGRPKNPSSESSYLENWRSDSIRRWIETYSGEFYQPKSRVGRFAETIGEFAPMILGDAVPGVVRGGQAAANALRALPGTLAKHAVAPGVVVQGLDEAYPESEVGHVLQKVYPAVRRGLPWVLAGKRYLSRRAAPR